MPLPNLLNIPSKNTARLQGTAQQAPVSDVRNPSDSELQWFRQHPEVGGMADFDAGMVVMNPYSQLSDIEKQSVLANERARLAMRKYGINPQFALTPEQQQSFQGYGPEQAQRETIVGRIISGDPSALNVTPEQRAVAEKLQAQQQPNDVVSQAMEQYPILKKIGLKWSYNPNPGKYGGIESWPANEEGIGDYRRPKEIPMDTFGVEVFKGGKVRPIDVLADVASHHLVNTDDKMKEYYQKFLKSLTPRQKDKLKKDYQYSKENEGETRSFEEWRDLTRLPGFFRGYTFSQWPDEFNKKLFTPEQIKLFDQVRDYLGVK